MVDLIDTNGVKPTLKKGVLGYDDYSVGGDAGRLYVGTGTASIAQAKKSEVDSKVPLVASTDNAIVRFDGTTGKVQNSGVVIDDSGNIGVGIATPTLTGLADKAVHINANTEAQLHLTNTTTGSTSYDGSVISVASNNNLYLYNKESASIIIGTNNSDKLTVDSSGNVGIGVTPSAWTNTGKTIQLSYAAISSDNATDSIELSSNAYYNAGWKYIQGYTAGRYAIANGQHTWYSAPTGTTGNAITWTQVMTLDTSGNLLLQSGTGGLGYGTGSGGTVTQLTSKSTAVTLNKPTGMITMNNAALASGATVAFILNNSLITSFADNIIVTPFNAYNMGNYNVWASNNGVGMCYIFVKNISGGSLSEPIYINFSVIKGALA